ncbi:MAG: hypothetical protein AAFW75_21220, partial [Cyanobacteria bacterium J06636_16]
MAKYQVVLSEDFANEIREKISRLSTSNTLAAYTHLSGGIKWSLVASALDSKCGPYKLGKSLRRDINSLKKD